MIKTLHISDLAKYNEREGVHTSNENDFLLVKVTGETLRTMLPEAFKIDAVSIFLCAKGSARLLINFTELELTAGTMFALSPDNLVQGVTALSEPLEYYAVFISREFLNMLSLDSAALDYSHLTYTVPRVIPVDQSQREIISLYFQLLHRSAQADSTSVYAINISRSLVSGLIYQLMGLNSRSQLSESVEDSGKRSRKNYYIKDFMTLVAKYYHDERTLEFYAEKLCISAKYLSLIVKDATGYTATEWIDHYVILEAKRQLRFSGRNIQQIAYDLNFSNQSAFGKYFKHQTGMSPSEFRNS